MFVKRVKNPRDVLMKAEVTLGMFSLDPVFVFFWMSYFRMMGGMVRGQTDREIETMGEPDGGILPCLTGIILRYFNSKLDG